MELITGPPPAAAISAMAAIDGMRTVPTMLGTQTGPESHLGPEGAGAILLLQGTFADRAGFDEFWRETVNVLALLATAPGFIRRYNFADGPHYTLIAWWRSLEDAHAFFDTPEHQAAMRQTFERRWNYTHFAGLWRVASPHRRHFFCQSCDGVMLSTESSCTTCGTPFLDPFGASDVPAAAGIS
jgi:heme-degrading monooxygenase HmoA